MPPRASMAAAGGGGAGALAGASGGGQCAKRPEHSRDSGRWRGPGCAVAAGERPLCLPLPGVLCASRPACFGSSGSCWDRQEQPALRLGPQHLSVLARNTALKCAGQPGRWTYPTLLSWAAGPSQPFARLARGAAEQGGLGGTAAAAAAVGRCCGRTAGAELWPRWCHAPVLQTCTSTAHVQSVQFAGGHSWLLP